jgi:hypothetical protein
MITETVTLISTNTPSFVSYDLTLRQFNITSPLLTEINKQFMYQLNLTDTALNYSYTFEIDTLN